MKMKEIGRGGGVGGGRGGGFLALPLYPLVIIF